ncbi:hypothetical protein [Neisseria chenwenguii]|uniref:Uncharacterized protein n=1 Tax=Neisseria chenwenguii TaxID=1853278 RepID=A0A220RZZ4_9NEIS|nr:hypothetical protein [Neisseria chenwenguii]ASK26801.1 hypothetical protein BG910_02755 [Neisseria chenwenguii]ROV56778.1 hypothetical protein EGS38_02770 [Neisseria chenwenguii]
MFELNLQQLDMVNGGLNLTLRPLSENVEDYRRQRLGGYWWNALRNQVEGNTWFHDLPPINKIMPYFFESFKGIWHILK